MWSTVYANEQLIFTTAKRLPTTKRIAIQVLREAYNKIGYEIKLKYVPLVRANVSANHGVDVDGILVQAGGLNREYSDLIQVPAAVTYMEIVAFAKKDGFRPSCHCYYAKSYCDGNVKTDKY